MNSSLQYPSGKACCNRGRKSGFTLVELMVSITIVVVMVLLFGQMLATTSQAWLYGHGRANNFTKARAMLELLSQDIQSGVFRPDLAAFPTSGSNATLEFYTGRPGIPVNQTDPLRNESVVQYVFAVPTNTGGIISNSLSRADSPVLWTDPAANLKFGSTTNFTLTPTARDTAPGVIAFLVIFIQSDGTFSRTFTPVYTAGVANPTPTRAVSVSLAVIDDITLQKLSSTQLTSLNTLLVGTVPTSPSPIQRSVKSYWDTYLNNSMVWTGYPKGLGSSLATFERYISLPNAP